ncbi:MAG: alpha/beta fold hydrolase [Rhodocyclaceae bacterium]
MNPFFFGDGQRRLFGLFTPGRGAAPGKRAIVLCHPWGAEYLYAHRALRQLASMLAAAGFHVLRFDYFGTGDSAGDMEQADLAGWEGDIEMAIEELKDTAEATWVGLIGLRLGGTLAARVAARARSRVNALVLWDPVVSGAEYLRELIPLAEPMSRDAGACASGRGDRCCAFQIQGFPLTQNLESAFRSIDFLTALPALPPRTLVISTGDGTAGAALTTVAGTDFPAAPVVEHIPSPPAWLEEGESGAAVIPVKVLQRIVGWLG